MQILVKHLGRRDYESVAEEMRNLTDNRTDESPDELWFVEHPPVFTQGQTGKAEHVLAPGDIPVIQSDRGGQVTYHGPGQIVCYLLIDIRRANLGVRQVVTAIEESIIEVLATLGICGKARPKAPGVYVDERKVASLGLRVRRGCTYHGLSLNVDMDLEPFSRINPCGMAGLEVTDLRRLGANASVEEMTRAITRTLCNNLGFDGYVSN